MSQDFGKTRGGVQTQFIPDSTQQLGELKPVFSAQIPAFSGAGLRVKHVAPPGSVTLQVSGSKSFTNRALVLAGMNSQELVLSGVLFSDDSYWGFECLQNLGFGLEFNIAAKQVRILPPNVLVAQTKPLYFGMAGTLARFFPAVVLNFKKSFPHLFAQSLESGGVPHSSSVDQNQNEVRVQVTGEKRLCERPLSELVVALRGLGANIERESLPLELVSGHLSGRCQISGAKSGQFLSGLLLAAAGSREHIVIERIDNLVQPDYVRMTLSALADFGAAIEHDADLTHFSAFCPAGVSASTYAVEADASTACYFMAFAYLHSFDLTISNLGSKTLQPDLGFAKFLERLGAKIEVSHSEVFVQGSATKGVRPRGGFHADFSAMSDQSLTAGVVALFADAPIEISGVEHIRKHESDRIAGLVANLNALGVIASEKRDGFTVHPVSEENISNIAGHWQTFHDHRFAMTGFLVASRCPGVEILAPECVEKTAPDFFAEFSRLGVEWV